MKKEKETDIEKQERLRLEAERDAKLTAAHVEIQAVFQKHDVAGLVLVCTPEQGRFEWHLSPSWSCAVNEVDANGATHGLRFRTSIAVDGVEGRNQKLQATAGMLHILTDMMNALVTMLTASRGVLDRHLGANIVRKKGTWKWGG